MTSLPTEIKVTANVTAQDIKKGIQGNCAECPLARALMRKLRKLGFRWVEVTALWVFAGTLGNPDDPYVPGRYISNHTLDSETFVALVDYNKPVKPGKFPFVFRLDA